MSAIPPCDPDANTCCICGKKAALFMGATCSDLCRGIQRICGTSVDEGVRYGIPQATLEILTLAEEYECRRCSGRVTILNAIHRQIRKLKKAEAASRPALKEPTTLAGCMADLEKWGCELIEEEAGRFYLEFEGRRTRLENPSQCAAAFEAWHLMKP